MLSAEAPLTFSKSALSPSTIRGLRYRPHVAVPNCGTAYDGSCKEEDESNRPIATKQQSQDRRLHCFLNTLSSFSWQLRGKSAQTPSTQSFTLSIQRAHLHFLSSISIFHLQLSIPFMKGGQWAFNESLDFFCPSPAWTSDKFR